MEHDLGKDLSSSGQRGDTPAVGADGFVPFVFVKGKICCRLSTVGGDTLSLPHFQSVKVKGPHAEVASFLEEFSWNAIRSRGFIDFEGFDCVSLKVGGRSGSDRVGCSGNCEDCWVHWGGLVEQGVEMLSPTLHYQDLTPDEGCSISVSLVSA